MTVLKIAAAIFYAPTRLVPFLKHTFLAPGRAVERVDARTAALRARGLCVDCGTAPTTADDGRCQECYNDYLAR